MLVQSIPPETSPPARMRRSEARRRTAITDEWDPAVSDGFSKNDLFFFYLQKWLNSAVICLICVEINRAPKIMKIFV